MHKSLKKIDSNLMKLQMYKLIIFIVISLNLGMSDCNAAQKDLENFSRNVLQKFYLNPDVKVADSLFNHISKDHDLYPQRFLLGALPELFKKYPDRISSWVKAQYPLRVLRVMECALWNIQDDVRAAELMARNKRTENDIVSRKRMCRTLFSDEITDAGQIDMLWAAFFTSGNLSYIHNIINAIDKAAQHVDMLDMEYLANERLHEIRGKDFNTTAKAIITKFKHNQKQLQQLTVGFSALWSLGSNANQDELVFKTLHQYIRDSANEKIRNALKAMMYSPKCRRIAWASNNKIALLPISKETYSGLKLDNDDINIIVDRMMKNARNTFADIDEVLLQTILLLQPKENTNAYIELTKPDFSVRRYPNMSQCSAAKPEDKYKLALCANIVDKNDFKDSGLYFAKLFVQHGSTSENICTFFYKY